MTVLVGILCTDGVVVGADSSSTYSNGQMPIIEQPTTKLHLVGNHTIWAGTGSVGLGQRFEFELANQLTKADPRRTPRHDTALGICKSVRNNFASTGVNQGQFGALVAFPCSDKHWHLVEFAITDMQPEFKTKDAWFVSMGSGQVLVDPFLALLRSAFFQNQQPTVAEGKLAAMWALQHAIEINPGGIQSPARIAVLIANSTKGFIEASIIADEELEEHKQGVEGIRKHLAGYRDLLSGNKGVEQIPTEGE